jgi:hypothetical protein
MSNVIGVGHYHDGIEHFSQEISKEIDNFAINTAFLWSRYLFTQRVQGIQFAYCTHCKESYMTDQTLKHNQDWACKKCKSLCTVKASGVGRKTMCDEVYFVYYEKSRINPQAMVARGIHAIRNYTGDYYKVETTYKDIAHYLYEPGKATKHLRYYWGNGWETRKSITSESLSTMKYKRCYYSPESIVAAAHGTQFQYCTWEKYDAGDRVDFFALAAKYPCIEYLTKLGLRKIVEDKLVGNDLYRTINWRGKTLQKVLRLDKKEINEIRTSNFSIDASTLRFYHKTKNRCQALTISEAYVLKEIDYDHHATALKAMLSRISFDQAKRYMLKQIGKGNHYRSGSSVLTAWCDYIKDCNHLGIELDKDHIFLPNDLHAAHQNTIRKVKIKADRSLNMKIVTRLKDLEKYRFEHAGFILRPAKSSNELFTEGKVLSHCVGGYAKKYAEGTTDLFVLRKAEDPETPFYTMEVREGKIIQTYGMKNCLPTDEVDAFIKAFVTSKLPKKKRKNKAKTKITQPDNRQEVAV